MKEQKGYSLLEVMVGLVILAIGLLGVAGLAATSVRVNANANHLTEAMNIGQAEMEKLKIAPWGTLTNGSSTVTSKMGKVFTNSWLVTTTGNLKYVTLMTSWVDGTTPGTNQPITHMVELNTKIAKWGSTLSDRLVSDSPAFFPYCLLRGLGENPSPLGEDFSMLAVWSTIGSPAIPFMT